MPPRVLILGAAGMLGHSLMKELDKDGSFDVFGSARDAGILREYFPDHLLARVTSGIDALDMSTIRQLLNHVKPDVIVNCIGVIKQDSAVNDAAYTIKVNSLFPHLLAAECGHHAARLIHISTDCVFSGDRGNYREADNPDPSDFYGRTKLLGEISAPPALTLRTSVIGHELDKNRSLVDWFLRQSGVVNGFTRAIYSGFTTIEFARLLGAVVLPRTDIVGLLHVASAPISKYDLLSLIAAAYDWTGELVPYLDFACDRSLSSEAFSALTGYKPPPWTDMIAEMRRSSWPARHPGDIRP
jgi:dTDP-4-dehydrorhamnose reductase